MFACHMLMSHKLEGVYCEQLCENSSGSHMCTNTHTHTHTLTSSFLKHTHSFGQYNEPCSPPRLCLCLILAHLEAEGFYSEHCGDWNGWMVFMVTWEIMDKLMLLIPSTGEELQGWWIQSEREHEPRENNTRDCSHTGAGLVELFTRVLHVVSSGGVQVSCSRAKETFSGWLTGRWGNVCYRVDAAKFCCGK